MEVAADREVLNTPPSKKSQNEWTCAISQVTSQSGTTVNSQLDCQKHKAAYHALKIKSEAEPTLTHIENSTFDRFKFFFFFFGHLVHAHFYSRNMIYASSHTSV